MTMTLADYYANTDGSTYAGMVAYARETMGDITISSTYMSAHLGERGRTISYAGPDGEDLNVIPDGDGWRLTVTKRGATYRDAPTELLSSSTYSTPEEALRKGHREIGWRLWRPTSEDGKEWELTVTGIYGHAGVAKPLTGSFTAVRRSSGFLLPRLGDVMAGNYTEVQRKYLATAHLGWATETVAHLRGGALLVEDEHPTYVRLCWRDKRTRKNRYEDVMSDGYDSWVDVDMVTGRPSLTDRHIVDQAARNGWARNIEVTLHWGKDAPVRQQGWSYEQAATWRGDLRIDEDTIEVSPTECPNWGTVQSRDWTWGGRHTISELRGDNAPYWGALDYYEALAGGAAPDNYFYLVDGWVD